jgi:hypothetical protein
LANEVTVWTLAPADAGDCTACVKHYMVENIQLDGTSFKVVEKKTTKKTYKSFQDNPLRLLH